MVWCCGYCLLSVFCVYDLWDVFVFTFNSVVVMLFFSYRLCCVLCFCNLVSGLLASLDCLVVRCCLLGAVGAVLFLWFVFIWLVWF